MFLYIKFDDGTFKIVTESAIPKLEFPINKFKKYKIVIDESEVKDGLIIYSAG